MIPMPDKLPIVVHKARLAAATDRQIATSANRLAMHNPSIWREERISRLKRIDLISMEHLGGVAGYSGSQLFVAALRATNTRGRNIESQPLLLKLVENNAATAEKLRAELHRYDTIRHQLPGRAHSRPIGTSPRAGMHSATRMVWSEFVDEKTISGLPFGPPTELRHVLEQNRWRVATDSIRAAYQILSQAHIGSISTICYYRHYTPYLRLAKGWLPRLRQAVGNENSINVLGATVSNPLVLLDIIHRRPALTTGTAHLSAVHGDLHPKNILVGEVFKACLIDFGWANPTFHTIVDFVFMEASLKFFRLPWHIPRCDLVPFERSLADDLQPTFASRCGPLRSAFDLIRSIRKFASPYIDTSANHWFVRQYLIPLFFVTVGLFPYAATIVNLEYLLMSSGMLATRIQESLTT
jgi:hypothetical protein